MRKIWLAILACAASVLPRSAESAEIIEVQGCAPGYIYIDGGNGTWSCYFDFNGSTGGGTGGGGGGNGGNDSGGGGGTGGGGSSGGDSWDPVDWREIVKQWKCDACAVSGQNCRAGASKAGDRCLVRGQDAARWRCDMGSRTGRGLPTMTPWGCSINQHLLGDCAGVEPPWDQAKLWDYQCGSNGEKLGCSGRGITTCEASWSVNHPSGSRQVLDSGTISATFGGLGASGSRTVSATYELRALTGYIEGCSLAAATLENRCTDVEEDCYATLKCDQ
jgi:hypothetical protein